MIMKKKEEQIQLENDEHILMRVRKHWFIIGTHMLSISLLAIAPLLIYSLIPAGPWNQLPFGSLLTLYTAWLLIMWMALWSVWTNYYLDVWTVTNKRLIAVDQKGFFSRTTASFRFERLQDIIVSIDGLIPTLLNFGSIEIQTASIEKNFKAYGLPNPSEIKAAILVSADTLIGTESPLKKDAL